MTWMQLDTANDVATKWGIGGAIFLSTVALLLKYPPWKHSNGNGKNREPLAGERTAEYWIAKQKEVAKEATKEYVESEDFRRTMQSIIGDWLDYRLSNRNKEDK